MLALGLLAVMATAAWALERGQGAADRTSGAVINISGRQRMLSQRIALLAEGLAEPANGAVRSRTRRDLSAAVNLMASSQQALLHGSRALGLPVERSRTILHVFYGPTRLQARVSEYLALARGLLASPRVLPDDPRLTTLQRTAGGLLSQLNDVVVLHARASERSLSATQRLQLGVLIATLLALLGTGALLFVPMVRRIRRDLAYVSLLQEVAVAANEASTVQGALQAVITSVCRLTGWPVGDAYLPDPASGELVSARLWHLDDPEGLERFRAASEAQRFPAGVGLPGRVIKSGQAAWVEDVTEDPNFPRAAHARAVGLHAAAAFPIRVRDSAVGVLEFFSRKRQRVDPELLAVMAQVGTQLGRVIERQKAEDQLAHLAAHDALTGLPNRALLRDRLGVAMARRLRSRNGVAILFVDLDGFKPINDSLGHAAGDALLVAVAARLDTLARGSDTVARIGGDEFVLVCDDVGSESEALALAHRVVRMIDRPVAVGDEQIRISASVGVAFCDEPEEDEERLLNDADAAMYGAKQLGGGQALLFEPAMRKAASHTAELARDIAFALERAELRLVYQPIVELDSRRTTGYETLLRWDHPRLGAVPPTQFIPIAEERGAILEIGRWVLQTACREAAGWPDPTLTINVNVSPRQLQTPGFVDDVASTLTDAGLTPPRLGLELTETALLDATDDVVATLHRLHRLGVRLLLDDFGTGFSSLSHLHRFPVDTVKIDRSFVNELDRADPPHNMVQAIQQLAGTLNLSVVAEGVETPEQAAALLSTGCTLAQGFHLGHPEPPEAIDHGAHPAVSTPAE